MQLIDKYQFIYPIIPSHPLHPIHSTQQPLHSIQTLSNHPNIIPIPQIPLHYHSHKSPPHLQKQLFTNQIPLPKPLKLPIIIHNPQPTQHS
ncbi:TatD family hydrolase, partial [Staphylococcus capitis]|uniref:TatD family hydrolase n=1 Tax=Staphylococcus capitis TaxID=29388 RepID=UPI001643126A